MLEPQYHRLVLAGPKPQTNKITFVGAVPRAGEFFFYGSQRWRVGQVVWRLVTHPEVPSPVEISAADVILYPAPTDRSND